MVAMAFSGAGLPAGRVKVRLRAMRWHWAMSAGSEDAGAEPPVGLASVTLPLLSMVRLRIIEPVLGVRIETL